MRFFSLLAILFLVSCKHSVENTYPTHHKDLYKHGGVFDTQGIKLTPDHKQSAKPDGSIKINAHLWHAALDVLSQMPLQSTDPFGGVIITEWYSFPENPSEMYKVFIHISGKDLRADALNLKMYKKKKDHSGHWMNENVSKETIEQFENTILSRASERKMIQRK